MMLKTVWSSALLLLAGSLPAATVSEWLDSAPSGEIWEQSASDLMKSIPKKFNFADSAKNRLHCSAGKDKISWMGGDIQHISVCYNSEGQPDKISLMFFSRGSNVKWTPRDFISCFRALNAGISEAMSCKPRRESTSLGGMTVRLNIWQNDNLVITMRHSGTRENPEFLVVVLTRPDSGNTDSGGFCITPEKLAALEANVKTGDDGVKSIDVPAVIPAAKVLAMPAVIERIIRYYGGNIDQYLLDNLTEKSTGDAFRENLKKNGSKLGLRLDRCFAYNGFSGRRFASFVRTYNRLLRAHKRKNPDSKAPLLNPETPGKLTVNAEILKEIRSKDNPGKREFFKQVADHIDRGIPLCWEVIVLPQKDGGAASRHLQIICGYNPENKSIIFTDASAKSADPQSLEFDDAWTVTIGLYAVTPRITGKAMQ